ncbi:type VII toxin-antitoxin system MntA family adenylyltransferase antitoxin [Clostridium manihotivorum]|uniref:Nucleotidyltransferase domain-containing protein n=1 Tax=Clostridium manihotivorum TaxID=2320868 RepID=A0A3R5UBH2_9CLOT|nr:nucleotidyltransferase domain-containing protein [Clostridium manihotivorum]QAA34751.1 nucleotidyltransferase domain-containing protein [Clostridium manihotivorum]
MNNIQVMLDKFLIEAEKLCDIKFAYLFGSYARKENNKNSDIDIAIMPKYSLGKLEDTLLRGNLIEIGKSIFKRECDVVFLNIDAPVLKYEIIKDGIVIKDHEERISFESLSIREYFDYKYFIKYYDDQLLEDIRNMEV